MKVLFVVTSVALLACGCANDINRGGSSSAGTTSTGSGGSGQLSAQDARFLREAAQSGLAEVRMGQLAAQNAQSPALKQFGQHLVEDHTQANQELAQIASQKGITMPMQMSPTDQQMIERLSGVSGQEFERMCQADVVKAHERAVQLFQDAAKNCQDPDLKAYAQKNLPTLQEHLRQARQLSSGSGTSSSQ